MRLAAILLMTITAVLVPLTAWALSCAPAQRPLLLEVESVIVDGSPRPFSQPSGFSVQVPSGRYQPERALVGTLFNPDSDASTYRSMESAP